MFEISVDAARRQVAVTFSGFMDVEEVAAFARAEQAIVAQQGWGRCGFALLVDTVDAVIQSREVVAAFTEIVRNAPRPARRIAVVRASSLTRLQTQRILSVRGEAEVFASLAEAEAWLADDGQANRTVATR